MKKFLVIVLLALCTAGCQKEGKTKEYLSQSIINKYSKANKIVIVNEDNKNTLGTISDQKTIDQILGIFKNSWTKTDGAYLCDGTSLEFKLYDDEILIDTVAFWSKNERIMPDSLTNGGCYYYTVEKDDVNLKQIIENNSDMIFYYMIDESDACDDMLELIFEDQMYKYYFPCVKSDMVYIYFSADDRKVLIKDVLKNEELSIEQIYSEYSDYIIRKEK